MDTTADGTSTRHHRACSAAVSAVARHFTPTVATGHPSDCTDPCVDARSGKLRAKPGSGRSKTAIWYGKQGCQQPKGLGGGARLRASADLTVLSCARTGDDHGTGVRSGFSFSDNAVQELANF